MIRGLPVITIYLYWVITLISLLWLFKRYRKNKLSAFIIVLFYPGLVVLFGKEAINLYKIGIFLWSITFLLKRNVFIGMETSLRVSLLCFVLFVLYSFISSFWFFNNSLMLVLSQLSKYFIPLVILLEFRRILHTKPEYLLHYNKLFGRLLIVQIILNLGKLVIVGRPYEGLVGSLTGVEGGGAGTSLPVIGLLWLAMNTNMNVKDRKNVLFLVGMMFIGYMTDKRAVWFLFPMVFILYGLYVARREYKRQLPYVLVLAPVFIYFGFRLTSTLNPDGKIWGSFDPEFAWNYAMDYSLGKEEQGGRQVGQGRVGANLLLVELISNSENQSINKWTGYGMKYIYAADVKEYKNSQYYFGVNHRGSVTGVFMMYIALGLIGVALFIIYYIPIFNLVKYHRLRFLLLAVPLFDFVFYNATIVSDPNLSALLFFLITFSSLQYNKKGDFLKDRRPLIVNGSAKPPSSFLSSINKKETGIYP